MNRREQSAALDVAKGASYIFAQDMAANIMTVVSFSILARLLTPAEIGEIAVLLMVVGVSKVVTSLGIPRSVTKFIAENIAKNDPVAAASVLYQAIRANLLLSLPVATAVFCLATPLSTWLLRAPDKAILFQILAVDLIAGGLLPTLNSAMLGLQKIKEMSAINLVYVTVRQTLIVALTLAARSLVGLVIAWVISELLATLVLLKYAQSKVGPPFFTFDLKRLIGFSFPLLLDDAANCVYIWFDQAALLTYLSLESLGVYSTAVTAFRALNSVTVAVGHSLLPTYSAIQGRREGRVLANSIREATRYLCLIGVPLGLGLFSTSRASLALFVGEAYSEGSGPLMILSLFFALTVTSTALVGLPVVLGETLLSLKLTSLSMILGVASTLILLPWLGVVGASIARGITWVTYLATITIALRRRIRVDFDTEALWKSLASGAVMAAAVLLIQAHYYSKYLLPAYVLLGGFIYLFMLLILRAIRTQDVQILNEYLGPRFSFLAHLLERLVRTTETKGCGPDIT